MNDFERQGIHVFVERAKRLQRLTGTDTPFYDRLDQDYHDRGQPWRWEDTEPLT